MTAILAYENLLEHADSTVTATSEASGYEVENAYDGLTHDYWQATAPGTNYVTVDLGSEKPVDYWAVFAHNLQDNAGGVRVQYSADNFSSDINEYGGNLIADSEDIGGAAWTNNVSVITSDYATAPDGATANKIEDNNAGTACDVSIAYAALTGHVHGATVYIAKDDDETRYPEISLIYTGGTTTQEASVFLNTKTGDAKWMTITYAPWADFNVGSVGDYWRVTVMQHASYSNTTATLRLRPASSDDYATRDVAAVGSIVAWGAHLRWVAASPSTGMASGLAPYIRRPARGLIWHHGDAVTARYWRFRFDDSSAASKVGVLALGKRLDLPVGMRVGFTPPHHGRRHEYLPQISESGVFIGRSLKRREYETEINLQHVEAAWVRQYLQPFFTHADAKPFFLCWDDQVYTWESAYCWLRDNVQPSYSTTTRMDVRLPVGATL